MARSLGRQRGHRGAGMVAETWASSILRGGPGKEGQRRKPRTQHLYSPPEQPVLPLLPKAISLPHPSSLAPSMVSHTVREEEILLEIYVKIDAFLDKQ